MKLIFEKYAKTAAMAWGGAMVLFILAYMLIISPKIDVKKQVQREVSEAKERYDYALSTTKDGNRTQLNKEIEELKNELGEFVVDSQQYGDLSFDISGIASKMRVGSFSIKSDDSRRYSEIPGCKYLSESYINVTFDATFNGFAALLNALERHRPVVFIDKFVIERSDGLNALPKVTMNLAVLTRKKQDG